MSSPLFVLPREVVSHHVYPCLTPCDLLSLSATHRARFYDSDGTLWWWVLKHRGGDSVFCDGVHLPSVTRTPPHVVRDVALRFRTPCGPGMRSADFQYWIPSRMRSRPGAGAVEHMWATVGPAAVTCNLTLPSSQPWRDCEFQAWVVFDIVPSGPPTSALSTRPAIHICCTDVMEMEDEGEGDADSVNLVVPAGFSHSPVRIPIPTRTGHFVVVVPCAASQVEIHWHSCYVTRAACHEVVSWNILPLPLSCLYPHWVYPVGQSRARTCLRIHSEDDTIFGDGPLEVILRVAELPQGTLLLCLCRHTQSLVGVLLVPPQPRYVSQLCFQEAQTLSWLANGGECSHSNILQHYAHFFGRVEGLDGEPFHDIPYILVTEPFVMTLEQAISFYGDGHGLPETMCRRYFKAIAIALQQLHRRYTVHRDVRASNVALTSYDLSASEVRLRGFWFSETDTRSINHQRFAVDVLGLGSVLYHMLAGVVIRKHDLDMPADILQSLLGRGVSATCVNLLARILSVHRGCGISLAAIAEHPWVVGEDFPPG